jgi:hypothetical protein
MRTYAAVLLLLPVTALAMDSQTTHCQRGDGVRIIEVVYPQDTALPCEVHYTKDGQNSVLWRASNETGYCEEKAAAFAEKQRGWGWQCVLTSSGQQPSEPDSTIQ